MNELSKMLEREGHYYLGDIVNKFLPGEQASRNVLEIPRTLTSSRRAYLP